MSYYKVIYDFYINETLISLPNSFNHNTTLISLEDNETIDSCYDKTVQIALDVFDNHIKSHQSNNELSVTVDILSIEEENISFNKIVLEKPKNYFSLIKNKPLM